MSGIDEESDFTVNTVRTSLFLGDSWGVTNFWRLIYMGSLLGTVLLGQKLDTHPEYVAIPVGFFALSLTNRLLQKDHDHMPHSFRRLFFSMLRVCARAQMVALATVTGIGIGQAAIHLGFNPLLPTSIVESAAAAEHNRVRDAASEFPKRIGTIQAELLLIGGLLEKSNVGAADARLRAVEGQLDPVLHSYAKDFVDVADVQKQVMQMRERITAQRQGLAANEAVDRLGTFTRHLDEIDHALRRRRFDSASRLWVRTEREMQNAADPIATLSRDIEVARNRLEQQRELIRLGFAHLPMPIPAKSSSRVAKRDRSKRNSSYGSRAMAADDR